MARNIRDSEANLCIPTFRPQFAKRKTKVVTLRLGPEQKKYAATYPDLNYYRKEVLAHRLLYFNNIIGLNKYTGADGRSSLPISVRQNLEFISSNCVKKAVSNEKWRNLLQNNVPCKCKNRPNKRFAPGEEVFQDDGEKEEPETEEEVEQRRKFPKRMRQDVTSLNVYEVLLQARRTAPSRHFILKKLGASYQNRNTICMEALHAGLNTHDWLLVSKCMENIAEDCRKGVEYRVVWTVGFLATVNLYPNNFDKLKELTNVMAPFLRSTFHYGTGIECATWLTQKGKFLDGRNFLKSEIDRMSMNKKATAKSKYYSINVKQKLLQLVCDLFEAAYHYSLYKKEMRNISNVDEEETTESRKKGEEALNCFQRVLTSAMTTDFDVTIFIEPLIELLVRYGGDGSKKKARLLFKGVCQRYFGNAVLEELYLKFLREHYPSREKEIGIREKKYARFEFKIKTKEKLYHEQILRRYLEAKSTDKTQVPLKKLPMPSFKF